MIRCDVLVCGAGPAGATAALNLATENSVLVIDAADLARPPERPGESLAGAAGRLLADMGLLEEFTKEGHQRCYARHSAWGRGPVETTELVREPDGPAWLLNRARFDSWLRGVAMRRGAALCSKTTVRDLNYCAETGLWSLSLRLAGGPCVPAQARLILDATGRHATVARRVGGQRVSGEPRLVCAWLNGTTYRELPWSAGSTLVEAVEDGWWYTAPLPGRRRVLAFHTDPDSARVCRTAQCLISKAGEAPHISATLDATIFQATAEVLHRNIAHGGMLTESAGAGWFATGDAAVHFDPLSSQGLLNALFTGLAAAEAAGRQLAEEAREYPMCEYQQLTRGIADAYRKHLATIYSAEQRWAESGFWFARRAQRQRGDTPTARQR